MKSITILLIGVVMFMALLLILRQLKLEPTFPYLLLESIVLSSWEGQLLFAGFTGKYNHIYAAWY